MATKLRTPTSVTLHPDVRKQGRKWAERENRSFSSWAEVILRREIQRLEALEQVEADQRPRTERKASRKA